MAVVYLLCKCNPFTNKNFANFMVDFTEINLTHAQTVSTSPSGTDRVYFKDAVDRLRPRTVPSGYNYVQNQDSRRQVDDIVLDMRCVVNTQDLMSMLTSVKNVVRY